MSTTTTGANPSRRLFWFSIRQLLVWTAAVAVACIALRNASPWWVATTFWLSAATVLVAVLLAVNRQGNARSYWTGFALCGSIYLLMVMHAWETRSDNQSFHTPLGFDRLPTSKLSTWLYGRLRPALTVSPPPHATPSGSGGFPGGGFAISMDSGTVGGFGATPGGTSDGGGMMPGGGGMSGGMGMPGMGMTSTLMFGAPVGPTYVAQNDFVDVSHSFWALLLAALAGWLSRLLFVTGQEKPHEQN